MEKSEIYFSSLLASLPELRASLSDHHGDLQTRELLRGLSFLESGYSMAIDLRARLAVGCDEALRLQSIINRLTDLINTEVLFFPKNITHQVQEAARFACRLSGALTEAVMDLNVFKGLQNLGTRTSPINEVESCLENLHPMKEELLRIEEALILTPMPVLRKEEYDVVLASLAFFKTCSSSLIEWSLKYPYLQYIFHPIREWLSSEDALLLLPEPLFGENSTGAVEALLNTLLYSAQVIVTETNKTRVEVVESTDDQRQILRAYQRTRDLTYLLSINRVLEQLNTLLTGILTAQELQHALHCALPFLKVYQNLVQTQIATHAHWTKALFKLDYVLCSTLMRLSKEGFCQPPETEEGDDGLEESLKDAEGTGLGEGSGVANISKEIEDESQLEGLKGEDEEKLERNKEGDDDNAVEMSDDFSGVLEDVTDGGEDEEDEEDAHESEASSDADREERLENLDPTDPSALDEKIWGDESDPQEDSGDKTGKDHSEEQSGTSEVVAKENDKKSQRENEEKRREDPNAEQKQDEEAEVMEDQTKDEEGEPNAAGAPMEDYVQDTNILDLPDNIELDIGEDEKQDASDEELEETGEEDMPDEKPDDMEADDESPFNDTLADGEHSNDISQDDDTTVDRHPEQDVTIEENADEDHAEETSPEEATAQPDASTGSDDAADAIDTVAQDHPASSAGQTGESAANVGQKMASQEKVAEETGSYNDIQDQSVENIPDAGIGNATSGVQEGGNRSTAEQRTQMNPIRSLGDTLKEIKQRFDEILNGEASDQPKLNTGPSELPAQLEYLQPDDEDQDMQALGPAGEQQVAKLDELKLVEDDTTVDPSFAMDVDEPLQPEFHEKPLEAQHTQSDHAIVVPSENVENAVLPSMTPQPRGSAVSPDSSLHEMDTEVEEWVSEGSIEANLRRWQGADFPESDAEHMWRLYKSMTHDLAYALCEQLRLILEPTLATRLKGDFRTGKRLNMKKIIPYIASDYTKDKIWLRRTKPSQREYQVLICIDDSRSMAESHSIHLAYQTLALISRSLSLLEAGDIAIVKFGGSVDTLHSFGQGSFTDQNGTRVFGAFTFKQKTTNVLSLVDTSLRILESARERRSVSSTSAADLWQLQIIISDGICQDHDKLRTLLRKAEEQKVMIVFIVLDSLHSHMTPSSASSENDNSILTMTKAEFKNVDGKMEMELQKYLDSFPFEYYVVLRNVEALPEVLAGTLKQFFERISGE